MEEQANIFQLRIDLHHIISLRSPSEKKDLNTNEIYD